MIRPLRLEPQVAIRLANWVNSKRGKSMHDDMHSPIPSVRAVFLCGLSIFLLFFSFRANSWRVAQAGWFAGFQYAGESLIVGRMVKSQRDGLFSSGGLTGLGSLDSMPLTWEDKPFSLQYDAYAKGLSFGAFTPYKSQIGGQGLLFSLLDRVIALAPNRKLRLFHDLTSALSALVLTAIIFWFFLEFGLPVALLVLASAVLSQWLVVFGRNLYWSMWAFYVPMMAVMHYVRAHQLLKGRELWSLAALSFVTVFMKCFLNGYNYITTFLVMTVVPLVYYGSRGALGFRWLFRGISTTVVASCVAVLASMVVLCFQIASVDGSFSAGVAHIVYSFEKRTRSEFSAVAALGEARTEPRETALSLEAGLKASTGGVLVKYLKGTYFDANNYFPGATPVVAWYISKVRYIYLLLLFLLASLYLFARHNVCASPQDRQRSVGLLYATWFSLLAPLSWFVVFKEHSFVHLHMNFIVWQMPFVFFGFALWGMAFKGMRSDFGRVTGRLR